MVNIYDVTKFTTTDYPGKLSCIVWVSGCNLNCKYCYNPKVVRNPNISNLTEGDLLEFLSARVGKLDAVVLSGGECTLSSDLPGLISRIKSLGFLVKVDTNGTNPKMIRELLSLGVIDYVALDFKSHLVKYSEVTGVSPRLYENFLETFYLLSNSGVKFEVRTTVHSSLLNEDDINKMINELIDLNYKGTYYLQNYLENNDGTLGNIENQQHIIDINKLVTNNNFKLEFRNFK